MGPPNLDEAGPVFFFVLPHPPGGRGRPKPFRNWGHSVAKLHLAKPAPPNPLAPSPLCPLRRPGSRSIVRRIPSMDRYHNGLVNTPPASDPRHGTLATQPTALLGSPVPTASCSARDKRTICRLPRLTQGIPLVPSTCRPVGCWRDRRSVGLGLLGLRSEPIFPLASFSYQLTCGYGASANRWCSG